MMRFAAVLPRDALAPRVDRAPVRVVRLSVRKPIGSFTRGTDKSVGRAAASPVRASAVAFITGYRAAVTVYRIGDLEYADCTLE